MQKLLLTSISIANIVSIMIVDLNSIDFGNEAGEDIPDDELSNIFVEQDNFSQYTDFKRKILIFTGRKGTGKSILVKWLNHQFAGIDKDAIVILCRGSDFTRNNFGLENELKNPNDYVQDWKIRISAIINRKIAQLINLPRTGDHLALLDAAEIDGFIGQNIFSALFSRLKLKLEKISINYDKKQIANEIEILKRVVDRKIVILVDDLDATFQNTSKECQELGAFFSAIRYLSNDVIGLTFRVTMRTDVWTVVRRFDEALDKIDQYKVNLKWNIHDFRAILFRRIQHQIKTNQFFPKQYPNQSDEEFQEFIISKVFVNKMKWGDSDRHTYRVIYTLAYFRPRWAIQLCKLAQEVALKKRSHLIDKTHIDTIWGEYGKKRIADLVSEHKHQCPQVEEFISAFRESDRQIKLDELLSLIKRKIFEHVPASIDGSRVNSPREIAHFLYRIGFIVARVVDDEDDSYEHYSHEDLPDLLENRTSNDFNAVWEIHPCYREALSIKKLAKSQRMKRGYIRRDEVESLF